MSASKLKVIKGLAPHTFAITANDLLTGDAVYLSHEGRWVATLSQAMRFATEEIAQTVTHHSHSACADKIVGAYVIGLDEAGKPLSLRESLRMTGPSNYHHGKQEQGPPLAPILKQGSGHVSVSRFRQSLY